MNIESIKDDIKHMKEIIKELYVFSNQIDIIKPKVLLLLGATPLKYILDLVGITKLHGTWHEFHGIKTLPSFHPAYLLRDPRQKKFAWDDLQKIMQYLGKTLPVQETKNS